MKKEEKEYYSLIKTRIGNLVNEKVNNVHLEITADKKFSDKLKAEIRPERDIIFKFLIESPPDITGFIKGEHLSDFIVIEFKKDKIKLDDIYQTKRYRDLFNAKFAFLISLKSIPEEIKRLHKTTYQLLFTPTIYEAFSLVYFNEESGEFREWYPENPFKKDTYWR